MPDYISVLNLDGTNRNVKDPGISSWARASTKPSYTALEVGAIASTAKGAANGVAELDSTGKVPSSQLPSYVDDVLEYNSTSAFPSTGEAGKIYVAKDTNKTYRWSGSAYVEISPSLALGETSSTAYRGDRGKTAYDHASAKGSAFSSGLYKITTNSEGHVTAATAVAKSDITALGIPAQDTTYSSKSATSGGTDVSLVTTGEKYTWNGKTSNTGTVTKVSTGVGLTGGDITSTGTISTYLARVAKDSKVFPGANKIVWEEYSAGTNYNLPSNAWYHIISMQGSDTKYGTQLALGMTTEAAYYRNYNNGTWGSWKSIIDTNTWRGIQNNLTSDSTTDSLSAKQGKVLKGLIDAPISDTEWTALTALFA